MPTDRGDRVADGDPGSRVGLAASSAVLLASLSFGAGSIHVWAAEAHVAESVAEAAAFALLAVFQLAFAGTVLGSRYPITRRAAATGAAVNAATVAVWLVSRSIGLPGLTDGVESVGLADLAATAFEVGIVMIAVSAAGTSRSGSWPAAPAVGRSSGERLGWRDLAAILSAAAVACVTGTVTLGGH